MIGSTPSQAFAGGVPPLDRGTQQRRVKLSSVNRIVQLRGKARRDRHGTACDLLLATLARSWHHQSRVNATILQILYVEPGDLTGPGPGYGRHLDQQSEFGIFFIRRVRSEEHTSELQ